MKRGISPLVASVLLIGFVVILAAVVMNWGGSFIRNTTEQTGETSEAQLGCISNVNLEVNNVCLLGKKIRFSINNKGEDTVDSFNFRVFNNNQVDLSEGGSLTGFTANNYKANFSNLPKDITKLEIIPKININGDVVACPAQTVNVDNLDICDEDRAAAVYYFEDGAADSSSYRNDGSIYGGANCSVNGVSGKACYFDGIDDYINIPDDDSLDFGVEDFSIEMWVKLSPNQEASGYPGFIIKSDFSSVGWIYFLTSNMIFIPKIGFYSNSGAEGWDISSQTALSPNVWHHIAVVFDRNPITGGNVSFYLDGSLDDLENLGPAQNVNNAEPLYIGRGWTGQYINATIDSVAIFPFLKDY